MSCDNHGATIKVADLDSSIGTEALKIIPFPEPGLWYIGFQLDCRNTTTGDLISCPESSVSAMVSVDVNIQPCDYRPLQTGINLIFQFGFQYITPSYILRNQLKYIISISLDFIIILNSFLSLWRQWTWIMLSQQQRILFIFFLLMCSRIPRMEL